MHVTVRRRWISDRSGRDEVERAIELSAGDSLTPLSLWTHGGSASSSNPKTIAPPEMARQDFARYSYCLPATSDGAAAGRPQCKNDTHRMQPPGSSAGHLAWPPGHSSIFFVGMHNCGCALCECRSPAAACMHDARTAASASASITSVSARTHWAQCRCHPAPAALLLRGAPPCHAARDGGPLRSGPPVPTSVVSSTSPSLLNLSAEKQPLAPGQKIS